MNATPFATPSACIADYCAKEGLDLKTELESFIWDTYKEVNGIRPRWMRFDQWTLEEVIEEADSLGRQIKQEREREEEEKKRKIAAANAKALEARKFNQKFNSLANAFA